MCGPGYFVHSTSGTVSPPLRSYAVGWTRQTQMTTRTRIVLLLTALILGALLFSFQPRALCNRFCGMVFGGFVVFAAASPHRQLARFGGAFSCGSSAQRATNNAAGRWGGGLAYILGEIGKPGYGKHHDPPSPVPLAGLLFGGPCPLRWLPADARRMPGADSAEAVGGLFGAEGRGGGRTLRPGKGSVGGPYL